MVVFEDPSVGLLEFNDIFIILQQRNLYRVNTSSVWPITNNE
jgi:hypothetical protein